MRCLMRLYDTLMLTELPSVHQTPEAEPAALVSRDSCCRQARLCPTEGKLDQSSHLGTHSAPRTLGLLWVSEGFKSLLRHNFSDRKQRVFLDSYWL